MLFQALIRVSIALDGANSNPIGRKSEAATVCRHTCLTETGSEQYSKGYVKYNSIRIKAYSVHGYNGYGIRKGLGISKRRQIHKKSVARIIQVQLSVVPAGVLRSEIYPAG